MSFTIFCNSCFETQAQIQRKFFITSCSHVFCETCSSSSRNVCRVCNAQCKVLEINKQMPSEVKIFLEENSIRRMAENIQKIQSFQENQVKLYYEKTMMFGDKYKEFKGTVGNMMEVKKTMANKMKSESGIMERLKNAYRSNTISTDLFQLGSSGSSVTGASQRRTSSTHNSTPRSSTSSVASSSSLFSLSKSSNIQSSASMMSLVKSSGVQSSTSITSKMNSSMMNLMSPFQRQPVPSQRPSPHNMIQQTQKRLFDDTLRSLHKSSQNKFQDYKREQMNRK